MHWDLSMLFTKKLSDFCKRKALSNSEIMAICQESNSTKEKHEPQRSYAHASQKENRKANKQVTKGPTFG
jgi:hypothetical protein